MRLKGRGRTGSGPRRRARTVSTAFVLGVCVGLPLQAQSAADSAWSEGRVADASRLYEAQVDDGTPTERALHRLALIRAWDERYDESLTLFDQLLERAPANIEARVDRARVFAWRGDLDGARRAFREVLEAHPDQRQAHLGLARAMAWDGQIDSAEVAYARLLEVLPRDAEAMAGHARMAAWQGDLVEAERRWRAALAHHPDHVEILTGLGQTLRWDGRSAAAFDYLERAVELHPNDRPAREEFRLARLSIAPRLGPTAVYESDSDGNRIATFYHDQSFWPSHHVELNTLGYARHSSLSADGSTTSGQALSGLLRVRFRTGEGWEAEAGGGGVWSSLGGGGVRPEFSARLATPGRARMQGWTRVSSSILTETVPLMRSGVRVNLAEIGLRGRPLARWRMDASAGLAAFDGEVDNRRWSGALSFTRRMSPSLNLIVAGRGYGFSEDTREGYFDPSAYLLFQTGIQWERELGPWVAGARVAPGIQNVQAGGSSDWSAAASARASLGYQFDPGRIIRLWGSYTSTGLRSFSDADADYRYLSISLTVGWAF